MSTVGVMAPLWQVDERANVIVSYQREVRYGPLAACGR